LRSVLSERFFQHSFHSHVLLVSFILEPRADPIRFTCKPRAVEANIFQRLLNGSFCSRDSATGEEFLKYEQKAAVTKKNYDYGGYKEFRI